MTDKHTPDEELPTGVWLRDGELIYELEPHVDGIGRTVAWNRFEIWVQSANKSLSREECESLAARIVAMNRSYDALLSACKEAEELIAKNTYPQPDKPNSQWGKLQRIRAAIALAEGPQ